METGNSGKTGKVESPGKSAERDLESVVEECRNLRQEISNLRTENTTLRVSHFHLTQNKDMWYWGGGERARVCI